MMGSLFEFATGSKRAFREAAAKGGSAPQGKTGGRAKKSKANSVGGEHPTLSQASPTLSKASPTLGLASPTRCLRG